MESPTARRQAGDTVTVRLLRGRRIPLTEAVNGLPEFDCGKGSGRLVTRSVEFQPLSFVNVAGVIIWQARDRPLQPRCTVIVIRLFLGRGAEAGETGNFPADEFDLDFAVIAGQFRRDTVIGP